MQLPGGPVAEQDAGIEQAVERLLSLFAATTGDPTRVFATSVAARDGSPPQPFARSTTALGCYYGSVSDGGLEAGGGRTVRR